MNGKCPYCGARVALSKSARISAIVFCDECDAELEVLSLNPVELDSPLEGDDDYSYSYEYEDEDDFDDNYDD
jgi:alpha-aminoadipate carrier protein LysW